MKYAKTLTAHEDHVMTAIHSVEDFAIDLASAINAIPEDARDAHDVEQMMSASDMLKDMMEARKNIAKIRYYSEGDEEHHEAEPWEHAYADLIEAADAVSCNMKKWLKCRYKATHGGTENDVASAERYLAATFVAHSTLVDMVMKFSATPGEKEVIMKHVHPPK